MDRAFRAPTNLEIYQTPPTGRFKLKQEKITTFEFNVIYQAGDLVRLQLNAFRNELRDVIVLGNLSGFTTDKNPGLININGLEGIVDLIFSKRLTGFLNFTCQDAEGKNLITQQEGDVPGVARWKANAGTYHSPG